jgi:cytochrome P450
VVEHLRHAGLTPELQEQAVRHREFVEYLGTLFARRRAEPTEDLVSALVRRRTPETFSSELYSMVVLLIVAGHETTVSLITNAVHALLTHPSSSTRSARTGIAAGGGRGAAPLRQPVERTITRWAAADVEPAGTVSRGELVIAVIGSANRDAERFSNAEELDLAPPTTSTSARARPALLPRRAARTPEEIALETLLRRLPDLRLAIAEDDLSWRPIPIFRSLAELPVAWDV